MIGLTKLARRSLLRLLALGVPGLLLGRRDSHAHAMGALEGAAQRLLPARRSAEAVGVAYLRAHPSEAARARAGTLLRDFPRAATSDRLVAALQAQVRRDFRQGDVVWVRGFLLSRSEARLCAWIALG